MSEDPMIVNPTFDSSPHADAIELGPIDSEATVPPVHPNPARQDSDQPQERIGGAESVVDDRTTAADPPPIVIPPDIARVGDDPIPPTPENLADPMM